MVNGRRLALAVFTAMLFDCAIRSARAMERYRRGELAGPRLPACEDLHSSKVVRVHVLISMAVLLVMVRSTIGPLLPGF